MTLTARDLAEITRLLEDSRFDELELEYDGMKIHLRRSGVTAPTAGGEPRASQAPPEMASAAPAAPPAGLPVDPDLAAVKAPLLGTFYRAPKPGAPPFVDTGARVEADTIIGIIEVMKLMNTVRAGVRGTVREFRARDGALVEYGEVLLTVDPQESA
jgi:acetyl-CoA carboxylase biotin carboxyl carrier protein